MKRFHPFELAVAALLLFIFSCKKDEIMLYNDNSYIQFTRDYADSSVFSFLALPDQNEARVPFAIELLGKPENRDRQYKISVFDELTNAPQANYSLPETFTLKANQTVDTAWITVRKTPEIAVKPVKLTLRIEDTPDFKIGQTDYSVNIVYISNVIARPDWWDDTVEGRFLGDYSDKKYELFIQVTGVSDFDQNDQNLLRTYTIMLKNYLLKEKDAGRTVYEDNGSEMTVALIGG